MDAVLVHGLIILAAVVVVFLFARLVNAFRQTETFKQLDTRYGLIVRAVTDAIFAAEVASPEVKAAYEEKSRLTGYPIKLLIVFDRVEAILKPRGIVVDFETEVLPIVERLLIERPEFPNKIESQKVIAPPEFHNTADEAVRRAAAMRYNR